MDELAIEAVNRERLSDSVKRQLTQLIIDRSIKPGDELPSEGELADRFGVSKPVIREALRELAALGVVEIQQGKLASVRTPSSEPLKEFFRFAVQGRPGGLREAIELRRMLETEIAMLAARRITDDEVQQLEAALAKMKDSLGTVEPWIDADLGFHMLMAHCAKNSLMLYLMEALSGLIRESIHLLHTQRPERDLNATLQRHIKILEALQARDPETARQVMEVHFDATKLDVLAVDGAHVGVSPRFTAPS